MKQKNISGSIKLFLVLMFIVSITGTSCIKRESPAIPMPVDVPNTFSRTGASVVPDQWWTALNDEKLNSLIAIALEKNLSLKATWDKLEQARAMARKAGTDLMPKVEGSSGYAFTAKKSEDKKTTRANDLSLGLSASYELDLWGRIRASRNASGTDVFATEQDLKAAAITLSGDIAEVWYKLVEQRNLIKYLDSQVKINTDYLDMVALKFRRGLGSSTGVLQQKQSLEAIKSERQQAASDAKLLENQLSILLGYAPGSYNIPELSEFPGLPELPAVGLPAELITKRPDIRSAFLRVQSANYRVASALAERFPKISLTAKADGTGSGVHDLFQNWLTTLGANLVVPIFDRRKIKSEIDRTKAAASESFHNYGLVVLKALKEVEDALAQESKQTELIASIDKQIELSRLSINQMEQDVAKGDGDFLQLLTMRNNHIKLERSRLRACRDRLVYRIYLYRSLGGDWELRQPEDTKIPENKSKTKKIKQEKKGKGK